MRKSRLIELFVAGATARVAASLVDVNSKTAVYYYHRLREVINENDHGVDQLEGEIEVDESYFSGRRKGKRGRGTAGKVPVFGLLKRNGKVYAAMIADAKTRTLMPIIRQKVKPDSLVYTDCWRGYNALDVSELNITVLIIANCLLISTITSTDLRISARCPWGRTRQNGIYVNLTVFQKSIFTSI